MAISEKTKEKKNHQQNLPILVSEQDDIFKTYLETFEDFQLSCLPLQGHVHDVFKI